MFNMHNFFVLIVILKVTNLTLYMYTHFLLSLLGIAAALEKTPPTCTHAALTIGIVHLGAQVRFDKELWKTRGHVVLAISPGVVWQRKCLHQVIEPASTQA